MPMLLWLLPGGFLLWLLGQRHAEARLAREASQSGNASKMPVTGAHYPFPPPPESADLVFERRGPLRPRAYLRAPARPTRVRTLTTADYLQHLHEATVAAQILDLVKPQALAADIATLMQAPPEVVEAFHVLSAPLDVIFAQKDLNVLGARPPLREDGVPSRTRHARLSKQFKRASVSRRRATWTAARQPRFVMRSDASMRRTGCISVR